MLFGATNQDWEVQGGRRAFHQHTCMVCLKTFETLNALWAHEDLEHPDVGVDVIDDETVETEEDEDE